MWRLLLVSASLGVSSFGYAGQAVAQSAPGALLIQDGMAAGTPAAVIPTAPAPQRVISVREGPALSVIVLPPQVAGSDPSLGPVGEPGRLLDQGPGALLECCRPTTTTRSATTGRLAERRSGVRLRARDGLLVRPGPRPCRQWGRLPSTRLGPPRPSTTPSWRSER